MNVDLPTPVSPKSNTFISVTSGGGGGGGGGGNGRLRDCCGNGDGVLSDIIDVSRGVVEGLSGCCGNRDRGRDNCLGDDEGDFERGDRYPISKKEYLISFYYHRFQALEKFCLIFKLN